MGLFRQTPRVIQTGAGESVPALITIGYLWFVEAMHSAIDLTVDSLFDRGIPTFSKAGTKLISYSYTSTEPEMGDLVEEFDLRAESSPVLAHIWFARQLLGTLLFSGIFDRIRKAVTARRSA